MITHYHPGIRPPVLASLDEFHLFRKELKTLNRYAATAANDMLTIKPGIKPMGLKPFPVMWWENEDGDTWVPDLTKDAGDFPPPGTYPYAHSCFPLDITHQIYKVRPDGGYGTDDLIGTLNSGLSSDSGDLAIVMRQVDGISLAEALGLVANSCERCHNIMLNHYGFDDGYTKDSPEAQRVGTHCRLCRQVDPEYDAKVREQDAGIYGPNIITASLNLNPRTIFLGAAHRLLPHLSDADTIVRVSLLEPESFHYLLSKQMVCSELAQLSDEEHEDLKVLSSKFHRIIGGDPTLTRAQEHLSKMGRFEETASELFQQTNDMITYMALCTMSLPERVTAEVLTPLRKGVNGFLERFRYKRGDLTDIATQTRFKFEEPAAVLEYQNTLLTHLSSLILTGSEYHREMALVNLKYLRNPSLPGLIHNP